MGAPVATGEGGGKMGIVIFLLLIIAFPFIGKLIKAILKAVLFVIVVCIVDVFMCIKLVFLTICILLGSQPAREELRKMDELVDMAKKGR